MSSQIWHFSQRPNGVRVIWRKSSVRRSRNTYVVRVQRRSSTPGGYHRIQNCFVGTYACKFRSITGLYILIFLGVTPVQLYVQVIIRCTFSYSPTEKAIPVYALTLLNHLLANAACVWAGWHAERWVTCRIECAGSVTRVPNWLNDRVGYISR